MKSIFCSILLCVTLLSHVFGQEDAELEYARAMYDTAVTYFMRYQLDSGEVYLDEALAIFEQQESWYLYAAAKTDKIQLGRMLGRDGMDALREYRYLEEEILPKLDNSEELNAKINYHIGSHYYYTSQYIRSEEHMWRSMNAMEHLGPEYDYRRADVLTTLAGINNMLHRTDKVIELYEQAIAFGELADPEDYQGSLQRRKELMTAWASLDSIAPIEFHMKVIEGFAHKLDPRDRMSQATLAETRASYLVLQGDLQEGLRRYLQLERDFPIFYKANDQRERLKIRQSELARQLGEIELSDQILQEASNDPILARSENVRRVLIRNALQDGFPSVALHYAKELESLALPEGRESIEKGSDLIYGSFASLDAVRYLVKSIDALADSTGDLAYNRQVLEHIDSFGAMLQVLRRKADLGELISLRDEIWIEVYELGIKSALLLYGHTASQEYVEKAWEMSEAAKAAVLLGSVNRIDPLEVEGAPSELIAREIAIKSELLHAQSQIEEDPETAGYWRHRRFELFAALDSVLADYEWHHKDYTQRRFSPNLSGLIEARASLGRDEVLLSFFYGQKKVYGISLAQNEVMFKELGQADSIRAVLSEFRAELNTRPAPEVFLRKMERLCRSGEALYHTVLAPLMPGKVLPEQLTLVPDGALSYIPFGALPIPNSNTEAGRPEYVAEHSRIRYSYSFTALTQHDGSTGRKYRGEVLALAPVFTGIPAANADLSGWGPIPGAAREVTHLKSLFSQTAARVDTINATWFADHAGDYRIIHLATHAFSDTRDPFKSALLLDGGEQAGLQGVLRTGDLYTMSIPADLVVLSACNTGDGPVKRGEGVMSIAHAFAYAGSPSVVMTLWPANDVTTQHIVAGFYEALARGSEKSEALTLAQRAYLNQADAYNAHPYYWAAVVSFGHDGPVKLSSANSRLLAWWIAIVVALLLAGIYLFRRRIKRQRT